LTLHVTDLIAIAALIAAGFAGCYALFLWKLRATLTDRRMKMADQIAALDDAIRALETRLAERQLQTMFEQTPAVLTLETRDEVEQTGISQEIAPEIQAAIAAAAIAAVGPNAVVHSVKPVTSPWTQQGRVLVQGGHNLRVRR
jgi:hypothetical protein